MTQLERISEMERILTEAEKAIRALTPALERYQRISAEIRKLEAYYLSPQWKQDYEDDCAGRLPQALRRGVLSEDAVYNLLDARDEALAQCRALLGDEAETMRG